VTRPLATALLAGSVALAGCSSGSDPIVGADRGISECRPDKHFAVTHQFADGITGGGYLHAFGVTQTGPVCTMSGWPVVNLRTADGRQVPTTRSKVGPPPVAIVSASSRVRGARFNAFSYLHSPGLKAGCRGPLLRPAEAIVTLPGDDKRTYRVTMTDAPQVCGAMEIGFLRSDARL